MLSPTQSTLRRLARETRGAEIAEAAAVLPLMFMILLGIFWFGQAFSIYGAITRAAQEGARAGAAPYCTTCTGPNSSATNAVNAVKNALTASHMNPAQTQRPATPPTLTACVGGSSSCSGTSTNMCVQTNVQITNTTGGATGVCGVAVTFQYPFQFYLPFTSLNKQKIWITASARVRMETQ
jgi:Flp pilus assembly protein TadG